VKELSKSEECKKESPQRRVAGFATRTQWREWLTRHFDSETEIWLVFPSKASGEASISYNDAVEEALCFGWIDGRAGTLDSSHSLRRFTPRRKGSSYSRPNIERLLWLEKHGMIHPKIRESVLPVITSEYVFPDDIIAEIRRNPDAWHNYELFPDSYKRIRVAYIDAARKRPEEFRKRMANFISKTVRNSVVAGYGGIEKYYASEVPEVLEASEFPENRETLSQKTAATILI